MALQSVYFEEASNFKQGFLGYILNKVVGNGNKMMVKMTSFCFFLKDEEFIFSMVFPDPSWILVAQLWGRGSR